MSKMTELREAGELLAKAMVCYHNEVAEKSKCEPDELTSQLTMNDDEYIYKIVITAEPLDDDRASERFDYDED